ncbi:MauE/DoxX family redox-associated membrane protein [Balneola sp. MJW-20]|uniref:MauE/DoxX family redox-associated membrane protein n=1 Tax=Gracilimonas aurantiaca TaxID=3234185 RepID=UPI003466396F
MNVIERYIRYIIGGVFLAAGVIKFLDPEKTSDIIVFFEILPHEQAIAFVYLTALVEVTLAILLVIKVKPKWTGAAITGLCFVFVCISLLGWLNNWNLACGCFGRFSYGKFDGMMTLRNSVLLVMSAGVFYQSSKREALRKSQN